MLLVIFFNGETHALIPLYAVGVFLSFTISQGGMVRYHFNHRHSGWRSSMLLNFTGALTTLLVLLIIATTKFLDGAWIIILLIPMTIFVFTRIRKHYEYVKQKLKRQLPSAKKQLTGKIGYTVIIPISGLHPGVYEAIEYALSFTNNVYACTVDQGEASTQELVEKWPELVPSIPLKVIHSPYRSIIRPLLKYMEEIEKTTHSEMINFVVPEYVPQKWYQAILHNHNAFLLRTALRFRKGRFVTSVCYFIER